MPYFCVNQKQPSVSISEYPEDTSVVMVQINTNEQLEDESGFYKYDYILFPIEKRDGLKEEIEKDINGWAEKGKEINRKAEHSKVQEDVRLGAQDQLFSMLASSLPDEQAITVKALYPLWEDLATNGAEATVGMRFQYNNGLCKVMQKHTFSTEWKPDEAHSLYAYLDESHSGKTAQDAIPFLRNMQCFAELYYTDPEMTDVLYRCIRDSGTPLQHLPHELVGHYFEIVEG